MPYSGSNYDAVVIISSLVAFALPLSLLIPDFSVWDVVPKVRVSRLHFLSYELTWSQLNAGLLCLLTVFFCIFLEIRKRKLDDIVSDVVQAGLATDATVAGSRGRQTAALRACVRLLDASADHYESLVTFRDELRRRTCAQRPPAVEPSESFCDNRER